MGNVIGPQMGATSVPTNNNSVLKCYTYNFEGQLLKPHCSFNNLCWRCGGGHPMICCPLKQENKHVDTSSIRRPRFQRFRGVIKFRTSVSFIKPSKVSATKIYFHSCGSKEVPIFSQMF